jgi:hypothetical protein
VAPTGSPPWPTDLINGEHSSLAESTNQVIGERAGIELTGLHAKLYVAERDVDLILHYDEQTHTVEMEVFQLSR